MLDLTENPKLIGRIFGPEYLLRLFLAGAMGGSVFYLVHHAFLAKCRQHLELLLENIPTMFQSSTTTKSCFGAAIKVHIMYSLSNDFYINRLEQCTKIL
ncbi:hypothetical protein ERO13_A06G087200v2 [Gossypium hirsutum]|uniref:Uncharacterized protein n=1 Tax=Gossypium barbadense TaxID=3634 RepID=A0A5J5VC83_GOSBA|nr:hypothetical protein ES319_A06G094800v1 [Gossypium barbadense]KAG4195020.1 hypothetical protein ERO13_A06G087200v2 [Gossypium hirsutum]